MRLKELREASSLTQSELGEKLGLSKSTIGNYEKGYRQPDLETLILLADYFQVTIDYLVERSIFPTFDISSQEEQILKIYRTIPDNKRHLIADLFAILSDKK